MLAKTCSILDCPCENPQPLENFYKDKTKKSGRRSRCKTCSKRYHYELTERRIKQEVVIPLYKECGQCREMLPSSLMVKKVQSPDGLGVICKSCQNQNYSDRGYYSNRDFEREAILSRVRYLAKIALKNGIIVMPDECQCTWDDCDVSGGLEMHHCNYHYPTVVVFLCRKHHKHWHHKYTPVYPWDSDDSNSPTKEAFILRFPVYD